MTAREARGECVFMCVLWGGLVMVWDEMGSVVISRRWNQNNMGTGTQFGIRLLTVISIKTHNPVTQYHYCRPDKLLSSEITSWCGNTSGRGQGAGGLGGWAPGGAHILRWFMTGNDWRLYHEEVVFLASWCRWRRQTFPHLYAPRIQYLLCLWRVFVYDPNVLFCVQNSYWIHLFLSSVPFLTATATLTL